NLGLVLELKGQVSEAMVLIQKAIDLDPLDPNAPNCMGAIYCAVKQSYDRAISWFQKAIALDPQFAQAHCSLGKARRAKNQIKEAIACYQKSIELAPKYAKPHNGLGVILCDVLRDY